MFIFLVVSSELHCFVLDKMFIISKNILSEILIGGKIKTFFRKMKKITIFTINITYRIQNHQLYKL